MTDTRRPTPATAKQRRRKKILQKILAYFIKLFLIAGISTTATAFFVDLIIAGITRYTIYNFIVSATITITLAIIYTIIFNEE